VTPQPPPEPGEAGEATPAGSADELTSRLSEQLWRAGMQWDEALSASAQAPPNGEFPTRVRAIAKAARQQQGAFAFAAGQGKGWRSRSGTRSMWLSYELRPGAPSRPGDPELWERFDAAVRDLGEAFEGVSLHAIAEAFGGIADIASEIAAELEQAGYGRDRDPAGLQAVEQSEP
jgi:hypothetical protein